MHALLVVFSVFFIWTNMEFIELNPWIKSMGQTKKKKGGKTYMIKLKSTKRKFSMWEKRKEDNLFVGKKN